MDTAVYNRVGEALQSLAGVGVGVYSDRSKQLITVEAIDKEGTWQLVLLVDGLNDKVFMGRDLYESIPEVTAWDILKTAWNALANKDDAASMQRMLKDMSLLRQAAWTSISCDALLARGLTTPDDMDFHSTYGVEKIVDFSGVEEGFIPIDGPVLPASSTDKADPAPVFTMRGLDLC